ncbi:MAG: indolepyruvate oxidoreductase subunit beta family protein, partial [Rubrivivax sp.]|nr:indolepyruvate oxidoreductase subunit beta family protein [Rubrivivax sp.]
MAAAAQPITILVCALGGEGGGVLSEWLYAAAVRAGHSAQSTSIPGVAQRTGATTYYVEVYPLPGSALAGRRPVFSLNPVPGAIDLLVSSELLETVRQVSLGMASAERTLVISSTARALTVAEKMQQADGRLEGPALVAALQRHCRQAELLDLAALARQAGTVVSSVLFGAIAASGLLPWPRAVFEDTIRASGKGVDASLRGFALAFDAASTRRQQRAQVDAALADDDDPPAELPALPDSVRSRFPAATHGLLGHAHARLLDYQDAAYAGQYLERLGRVRDAEQSADPAAAQGWALTQEMTRWLALWMAFDDIVRVAQLKLTGRRLARV